MILKKVNKKLNHKLMLLLVKNHKLLIVRINKMINRMIVKKKKRKVQKLVIVCWLNELIDSYTLCFYILIMCVNDYVC